MTQKLFCVYLSLGDGVPTIFVAVAGRSNGLGPVMSGNTAYPVVNCPPLSAEWGAQDVWSSLRLPSGKLALEHSIASNHKSRSHRG